MRKPRGHFQQTTKHDIQPEACPNCVTVMDKKGKGKMKCPKCGCEQLMKNEFNMPLTTTNNVNGNKKGGAQ